jgi:hypothetical protein
MRTRATELTGEDGRLLFAHSEMTNDIGEFRLPRMEEGTYLLFAQPPDGAMVNATIVLPASPGATVTGRVRFEGDARRLATMESVYVSLDSSSASLRHAASAVRCSKTKKSPVGERNSQLVTISSSTRSF